MGAWFHNYPCGCRTMQEDNGTFRHFQKCGDEGCQARVDAAKDAEASLPSGLESWVIEELEQSTGDLLQTITKRLMANDFIITAEDEEDERIEVTVELGSFTFSVYGEDDIAFIREPTPT